MNGSDPSTLWVIRKCYRFMHYDSDTTIFDALQYIFNLKFNISITNTPSFFFQMLPNEKGYLMFFKTKYSVFFLSV